MAVIKLARVGQASSLTCKISGSDKEYQDSLDLVWDSSTQTRNTEVQVSINLYQSLM